MAFIGPFDYAAFGGFAQGGGGGGSFAAFAQNDGRSNADELDGRFTCDRKGQAIDGEGAYDRPAVEHHVSIDECRRLASKGRGEGQWSFIGFFGCGTCGPFAQGNGRLAFRIRTCTAIRGGAFRSFFRG